MCFVSGRGAVAAKLYAKFFDKSIKISCRSFAERPWHYEPHVNEMTNSSPSSQQGRPYQTVETEDRFGQKANVSTL